MGYSNTLKVSKEYESKLVILTKLMKIANDKKALENEVRTLSVRIEEIETNSVATSKRTIQKMEIRITELEEMINVEKKSHAATMTELQTKTRQIKELVL